MSAPGWTCALLSRLAPPGRAEDVLGDLEEAHRGRVRRRGRPIASVLTGLEALDMAVVLIGGRIRRESPIDAAGPPPPPLARTGTEVWLNPTWVQTLNPSDRRWQMRGILEAVVRDFVHATRSLMRAPGFTVVTVATLALAIGSNTAIFSVVNAVLVDPLPYPAAERLVSIRGLAPGSELQGEIGVPDELYVQYRESADRLEDLAMYGLAQTSVRADDRVERLFVTPATASLFTTLGARPVLGRLPTPDDDGRVVVISHWLWTTWFGADPAVLDRSYNISGAMRTVIGIMGPEFRFPDERTSLWINLPFDPSAVTPGGFGPNVVGRMAPGTDHAGLAAQLAPLATRTPERFGGPARYARIMEQYRPVVRSLEEHLVGNIAKPLWILLGTVGIVLLIACVNVANLFIVRTESRRQDLAVRRALGAGRAGLIRSQMAEALILAAMGGVGGTFIAWAGIPLLLRVAPEAIGSGWGSAPIPGLATAGLDVTALLFTAGVSILAACAFGLAPAIQFSGVGLLGSLRQAGRGVVGRGQLGRDALVVIQTALALVLLVASALLVRSFLQLSRVDPGFDTEDIFTFQIHPQGDELSDGPSYARFHYGFMERLAALPAVASVGLVNTLPLDEGAGNAAVATERTEASGAEEPMVRLTMTGGDYFQTMGIELLRGRFFERIDEATGVANAIVSSSAAERLWPDVDPVGQRFRPPGGAVWWTVVGVVEDVLLDDFRRQSPEPLIYLPLVGPTAELYSVQSPAYVVKSPRARVLASEVRALVREVAPESPMYRIFTMDDLAARSMAQLSFTMLMLVIAAGLALILGAVGIYGVLSYQVTQRTREIGVRMALGAGASTVRRMVVAQGGRVTLVGVVIGVISAVLLTRVLESLLFGVAAIDAPTFVAMSGVMLGVALLASYLPARRASSVDPMRSLRAE